MDRTLRAGLLALLVIVAANPLGSAAERSEPTALLVGFHEAPPVAVGDEFHGARVEAVDAALRFARVLVDGPDAFEARARDDARVRYIEPDGEIRALYTPNDPRLANGQQYAPGRIQAHAAWDKSRGDTSVQVCIVDSGVLLTHEDIVQARYLGGMDFVDDDTNANDGHGHGTFVTAVAVGGIDNGKGIAGMAAVAWRHARVLDNSGAGRISDGASGIRWCADQGAFIVSASLGTTSSSTTLRDAVDHVWAKGSVFVAASGNDGCSPCVNYPAAFANAIAVGCTDASDNLCSISSGGPELDIVAPGHSIVSAWRSSTTTYVSATGTSASAPHVAGALALMKSYGPDMTNVQARTRLLQSVRDLGAAGFDHQHGHGLLQAGPLMGNSAPILGVACAETAVVDATLGCTITLQDAEGHRANVTASWGDGDTETVALSPGTHALGHRYAQTGSFVATFTARDIVSDPLDAEPLSVTVTIGANTPPAAPTLACSPQPSAVGRAVTCRLASADDSDGVAYEISWGDGTTTRVPATGEVAPGGEVQAVHQFTTLGEHEVYARATDNASVPLLSDVAFHVQDVRDCAYARDGRLTAGTLGLEMNGVSVERLAIPLACGGIAFSLVGSGLGTDYDVCWYAGDVLLSCHSKTANEFGFVPETADTAEVILWAGANARYSLRIPG